MTAPTQTYANHHRYVPAYHFVLLAIVLANLAFAIVHLVLHPTWGAAMGLTLAIGLGIMYWYMREFVVAVQDRVIRLEERLRLERLLPAELKGRIEEASVPQLIALRFASDDEVVGLFRRALDENLGGRDIKQAVKHWRADNLRA